jgi:hypothetical protein
MTAMGEEREREIEKVAVSHFAHNSDSTNHDVGCSRGIV